jgi:hypothetical protein
MNDNREIFEVPGVLVTFENQSSMTEVTSIWKDTKMYLLKKNTNKRLIRHIQKLMGIPCQEAVECDICSRWQHRKCGNMGKFFFHWNISSNVQNLPYPEMTLHLLILQLLSTVIKKNNSNIKSQLINY